MAEAPAETGAAVFAAGKDHRDRRTSRSSAASVHMEASASPRDPLRRAGAHPRRMVDLGRRNEPDTRLLSRRNGRRRPLLAVPRCARRARRQLVSARRGRSMSYAELQVTSHFSFLRGASSAEELFAAAALLGIDAVAVTDRNSLAGIVRAHEASKVTGVPLIVGCRLDLQCGTSMLVYPVDRAGYGRLCRLLSIGKTRAGKGACHIDWPDVERWSEGLLAILLPDDLQRPLSEELDRLQALFGGRAYCALTRQFLPDEAKRLEAIDAAAWQAKVQTVVTNDVLYHDQSRRMLQDVVTCIRLHTTIDSAGFRKERHADRFLKPPAEMYRLFPNYAPAVQRTMELAARCRFSLDELKYSYPTEVSDDGLSAQERLEKLTWIGAGERYPESLPDNVATQIRHELTLIERLEYAPYFLTVESIVRFARSKGILCQGRGSAANSAVCYALDITAIDPVRQGLLFERFISEERREPPDIDVDFEHERREEVIQWIYETYGRTRSALTAVVSRYRSRGAVREVGKALGLPADVTGSLARLIWGWSEEGVAEREAKELNLNLEDRRLKLTLDLARQLIGTPRHLSQHPGGFVLTLDRLDEMVPVEPAAMENRQVIEWDKDDIDALKFMKVDVLGLGMLGCMRRAFDLLDRAKGKRLDLATIPSDDPATYAMIRRADTTGVFQIESRAQMNMLPRMKPRRSTISSSRSPSYGQVRYRATWCIPTSAGGRERRRSNSRLPPWRRCSERPSASRCFRNRQCRSRWSRPASRRPRPISCGARWRRSSSPAASTNFRRS